MSFKQLLLLIICSVAWFNSFAQTDDTSKSSTPNYKITRDDPYDLHKFFLHFQPFYADLAAINVTAGFGIEANYFHEKLFDLTFSGRTTYGKTFDIARDAASKNGVNNVNKNNATPHFYLELGGTYHITDKELRGSSSVTLYDGALKGAEWAATVPDKLDIDSKVREIIGVRLGGIYTTTTTDLTRALEQQNSELTFTDGAPVVVDNLYTNVSTFMVNIGGSLSWFRNFLVEIDAPWAPSGNDHLFTTYVDFLYAPSIQIEDILLNGDVVSTDNVNTNVLGFRAGMTGKFDRKLGWGYGAELGIRPGLQKRGFFLTAKFSFPIFGSNLLRRSEVNRYNFSE